MGLERLLVEPNGEMLVFVCLEQAGVRGIEVYAHTK